LDTILREIFHGFPYFLQENDEFYFLIPWGGVRLSPLGMSATIWTTVPNLEYGDDCGAVGGISKRKPAPVSLCPQ
jgi:hypothetical protein